jgi:hypothetical protein
MKTQKIVSVLILTLFIFSSCVSVRVSSDYDSKTDFTKYKTFAFYKKGIDKSKISDLDKKRILRAIESELIAKGMTKSSNPDLLVSIFAKSQKHVNLYNNSWYPNYYTGWNNNYSRYTEGTLLIDLIDKSGKKLLWQGVGKGFLNTSGKVDKKEARINEFVAEVMKVYPPTK